MRAIATFGYELLAGLAGRAVFCQEVLFAVKLSIPNLDFTLGDIFGASRAANALLD
jgi:hypothetical protein